MLKSIRACAWALLLVAPSAAGAVELYEPLLTGAPLALAAPPPVGPSDWYVRGDLGYRGSILGKTQYIVYVPPGSASFDTTTLKAVPSLAAGIGFRINRRLRADLTADYWFSSDLDGMSIIECDNRKLCPEYAEFHLSSRSAYNSLLLLANAYVDLGTYHDVTPYVGAGLGGALVKWSKLENAIAAGGMLEHGGVADWRFAYALAAGAAYCLTETLSLDLGYRYTRIDGGRMFDFAAGSGPVFDAGIDVHEARTGLRYQFGGNSDCTSRRM